MVNSGAGYALPVGMVYCLNLMMGAGVLALPKAFAQVGWILGLVGITLLAFINYLTVTFIIEAQSVYNAIDKYRSNEIKKQTKERSVVMANKRATQGDEGHEENYDSKDSQKDVEDGSSDDLFEILITAELGELCHFFLTKFSNIVFSVALCLTLFASPVIYVATISKSLASVICQDKKGFHTGNDTIPCNTIPQTLMQAYQISLAVFAVLCCPFAFFTIKKTKILQISTMVFRAFALVSMIVLALIKVSKRKTEFQPEVASFSKLPGFIGAAMYTFVCHFPMPAIVTPVRNKKNLSTGIFITFCLALALSTFLSMTAVFAFETDQLQDVYTLNFQEPLALKYILELFPVLTLGGNYPLVVIALRDNIKKIFMRGRKEEEYGVFVRRILFAVIAIAPSLIIPYFTYDVGMVVGQVGAYVGGLIQCVIPVLLVHSARKRAVLTFGEYKNRHASPLNGVVWLVLIMVWWLLSLGFVT